MLLTVRDVARRLSVSTGCVYSLVGARKLAYIRIGSGRGRIRIRQEDVEEYLSSRLVEARDSLPKASVPRLKHIRLS